MYENYKPSIFTIFWELYRVILQIFRAPLVHFLAESIVIVMDPIDAYADLYNVSHIESINRLIRAARKKDIPVVATRWMRVKNKNPMDAIDSKGHWTFYIPDNQTNIMSSIDSPSNVVEVTHTNAFIHEEFRELVKDKKHLILAGAWLESCIINTTRCALDNNMSVSVVKNASTGHFPFRWISLIDIQSVYGEIVTI
tara:strand:+ start:607 stop:1197 length:591 start_codon:yes stop_codon:yes gene_type:complete